MTLKHWLTATALIALVAASATAQDGQRRRPREQQRQGERVQEQAGRERAVPRTSPRREEPAPRNEQVRRDEEIRRNDQARRDEQARRDHGRPDRGRNGGRYDNHRPEAGRYAVPRRYTPRVIRPTIVRVIPYRPYVYRPSYSTGVYYGADGYYPYGRTPRGYFEPVPGRYYGGVRITGAPRDARVFADGYYVGIVNDFDGIFQHINLEAGPHHIEVDTGYDGIEFDVYVRPGETTTFRADGYRRY